MVSIYSHFQKDLIEVNDDYKSPLEIKLLNNVSFQFGESSENRFLTPVGVCEGRVQSILNKLFYYNPEILGGVSGISYTQDLRRIHDSLVSASNPIVINEPVFYCIDYESTSGTGHMYDILFYLAYFYKKYNLDMLFLVAEIDNIHYKALIGLLEEYLNIRFLFIQKDKAYSFQTIYAIRTYLNIYLPEVKDFINNNIISKILKKYDGESYYNTVARLKVSPKQDVLSKGSIFKESERMDRFCHENGIYRILEDLPEDKKIYLLNKATTILVSWGSIYYIYIDYYLANTDKKYISVLFHKEMMPERRFLYGDGKRVYQTMTYSFDTLPNIYKSLSFEGEILDNLETLDEYVERTSLNRNV